jgi:threonine synthase
LIGNEKQDGLQTICLSTASPGKFPEVVISAINDSLPANIEPIKAESFSPKALLELSGRPQRFTIVKTDGDKKSGLRKVRDVITLTLSK